MKKGILVLCAVAALLILLPFQVMAQEGRIHVGNLKIIPGIKVQGVSDDNIYLGNGSNNTTENKQSDFITHFMPKVALDYTFEGRGSAKVGYEGDWAVYSSNSSNDWNNQKGFFNLDYQAPGGLIVGIDNTYTDAEDPYGNDNDYKRGVPHTKRVDNDLKTKIGYNFGNSFKVLVYYNNNQQDYDDNVKDYTQDYRQYEAGLGVSLRFLPKTWGFIRYYYGERDYNTDGTTGGITTNDSNDSDFKWHRVNVGLTWDSGAKLGGELNFGYQWRDYKNEFDSTGARFEEKNTWIAATSVNFFATETTTLGVSINRALRETGSGTNEFYEDTGVGLNVSQKLMEKLTLSAGVTYSYGDYNLPATDSRKDDNYAFNAGIDYKIQEWLNAGIGYEYKEKDSNYDLNDYKNNQFKFSVTIVY